MSATAPLISVVLPAYNAEETILETLQSVLEQTYRYMEVLVVDDGSSDSTAAIVERVAKSDRRVRLITKANGGVADARNAAIAVASGEYVAPIDADDLWFPRKLEKQMAKVMQSPGVGLVYAWTIHMDEAGEQTGGYVAESYTGYVLPALMHGNFVGNASAPLIPRACFDAIGGYDSTLHRQSAQGCEDLDLYLRIAERWPYAVVPEFLIAYRLSGGNMSRQTRSMDKSFRIVSARARMNHPEVPRRIKRWSRGHYRWYLGWQCARTGEHWRALRYKIEACVLDPQQLVHFSFQLPKPRRALRVGRYLLKQMHRPPGGRPSAGKGNSSAFRAAPLPGKPTRVRLPSLDKVQWHLANGPFGRWEKVEARRRDYLHGLCAPAEVSEAAENTYAAEVHR